MNEMVQNWCAKKVCSISEGRLRNHFGNCDLVSQLLLEFTLNSD